MDITIEHNGSGLFVAQSGKTLDPHNHFYSSQKEFAFQFKDVEEAEQFIHDCKYGNGEKMKVVVIGPSLSRADLIAHFKYIQQDLDKDSGWLQDMKDAVYYLENKNSK